MTRYIAFAAPPFAGHLNPLLTLAKAAQMAGYRVQEFTGAEKISAVHDAGLSVQALKSLDQNAVTSIANESRRVGSNPFRLAIQMRQSLRLLVPARDELLAHWRDDPPDLIVSDFVAVPAGLAADQLGLPWITVLVPAFVLETTQGPPSYLGGLKPMPGLLGRVRDRAGWWLVKTVKDALAQIYAKELTAAGLKRLRADGSEAIYSPHAQLAFAMKELEFERPWPTHFRFLGPEARNPEILPPTQLPEARPRVLVTFGTHLPWAKAGLVAETEALSARVPEASFVVSLGDPAAASPEPIEVRGRVSVFAFVPYMAELEHFDAVIHHGGAGIVYAVVMAGKPSLVCPQDYDQFDYAARLEYFGLATRIKRLDSAKTADTLREISKAPPGALADFAAVARTYDPGGIFLETAKRVIAGTGNR